MQSCLNLEPQGSFDDSPRSLPLGLIRRVERGSLGFVTGRRKPGIPAFSLVDDARFNAARRENSTPGMYSDPRSTLRINPSGKDRGDERKSRNSGFASTRNKPGSANPGRRMASRGLGNSTPGMYSDPRSTLRINPSGKDRGESSKEPCGSKSSLSLSCV
jgi:hypothetical protein